MASIGGKKKLSAHTAARDVHYTYKSMLEQLKLLITLRSSFKKNPCDMTW